MSNNYAVTPDFLSISTRVLVPHSVLFSAFNYPVSLDIFEDRKWFGYSNSGAIVRGAIGGTCNAGVFAFTPPDLDASGNAGSFISLTGAGCWGLDVSQLISVLLPYHPTITRLDLAIDFYDGELSYDQVVKFYERGLFHSHGFMPQSSTVAPVYPDKAKAGGYTFYVGKGGSSKMVRAYEKTFEQYDKGAKSVPYVNWFRFEIQLRSKDYVIPLDFYNNYDGLLCGLYPLLFPKHIPYPNHSVVGDLSDKRKLPYHHQQAVVSLEHLKHYARLSYGGLFHVLRDFFGESDKEIVDSLFRPVVPSRLNLPLNLTSSGT